MPTVSLRVNAPDVVHEVIDGEAVIVNLSTGIYYSVERVGADIWTLLEGGTAVPAIVDALAGRYTGSREEVQAGVDAFVAQLQEEGLVVPDTEGAEAPAAAPAASASPGGFRPPFEAPTLGRYTDMEDLLLLDPVHEVDEQGWQPGQVAGA